MITTEIIQWCATEVDRQGDGPLYVPGMFRAWGAAVGSAAAGSTVTEENLKEWNWYITLGKYGKYRQTPATFANGGHGLPWTQIPRQMGRLIDAITRGWVTASEAAEFFLDVHPFADGNGRTASLLFNVLSGTITNPVLLPNFYAQEADDD